MDSYDMYIQFYVVCCLGILALAIWTAIEDEKIINAMGEQFEGTRLDFWTLFVIVLLSFIPVVNIIFFVITMIYRAEGDGRVHN